MGRRKQNSRRTAERKRKGIGRGTSGRPPQYSRLTAEQKAEYERALNLLSDLRRGAGSYRQLLQKYHLDTRTARKYLGRSLLGGTNGEPVHASKADKLARELMFPMSYGDVPILTRNSRDATKLSNFFQDRDKLLRGTFNAGEFEAKWRGVRIAGKELFADAEAILGMADADVLQMDDLYASVGPER